MLDRLLVIKQAMIILALALVLTLIGATQGALIFSGVAFILIAFAQAIRPYAPPQIAPDIIRAISKDALLSDIDIATFVTKYSTDPVFAQALLYLHGLTPVEFMRVVRITIELRQSMDAAALRSAAAKVRKAM